MAILWLRVEQPGNTPQKIGKTNTNTKENIKSNTSTNINTNTNNKTTYLFAHPVRGFGSSSLVIHHKKLVKQIQMQKKIQSQIHIQIQKTKQLTLLPILWLWVEQPEILPAKIKKLTFWQSLSDCQSLALYVMVQVF